MAYERTLRLSGAEQLDYWTYQNNYPLVSADGKRPFPVWHVLRQLESALPPGARLVTAEAGHDQLQVLPARGPAADRIAILLVNSAGAGEVRLKGLPPGASFSQRLSTRQAQGQSRPVLQVAADGSLRLSLPSRSLLSLISPPQN